LSLRVPRVVGANPLAPLALLRGQGGGGLPPGMIEQLLRTLGVGPRMQAAPGGPDPNALGVAGAPSPIARMSGLMPSSFSGAPVVSVSAVARPEQPEPGAPTVPPVMPPPPAPMPGPSPSSSEDYWAQARAQREAMGRISY